MYPSSFHHPLVVCLVLYDPPICSPLLSPPPILFSVTPLLFVHCCPLIGATAFYLFFIFTRAVPAPHATTFISFSIIPRPHTTFYLFFVFTHVVLAPRAERPGVVLLNLLILITCTQVAMCIGRPSASFQLSVRICLYPCIFVSNSPGYSSCCASIWVSLGQKRLMY